MMNTNTFCGMVSSGCQVRSLVTVCIHMTSQMPLASSKSTVSLGDANEANQPTSLSRSVRNAEGMALPWGSTGGASSRS